MPGQVAKAMERSAKIAPGQAFDILRLVCYA